MISSWWKLMLPIGIVVGVCLLVASAARDPLRRAVPHSSIGPQSDIAATVSAADQILAKRWQVAGVEPAVMAEELTVLRRLSLALLGSIPSLEEIRVFEADAGPDRLSRWTERMLADRRFAEYFAARLSRVYVGADVGQFIVFRRDRFNAWLADQLQQNTPYDQIVREMLTAQGLWTGRPATNFVTAAFADGNLDRNELAGRAVRAFLGQRIDCAQCHNHPFADWKQAQFEGLAACFGQIQVSAIGIEDNLKRTFEVDDPKLQAVREVAPDVPFHPEWFPGEGTSRQRLAAWVTHPENRRFERATVNRVWGLMFGRPWIEPVDDLPNPEEDQATDLLDLLGRDFREHDYDFKRLIRVITALRAFRLSSEHPAWESGEQMDVVDRSWAAFPLTRLRPEQVIGSMIQASSLKTADREAHLLFRTVRMFREIDFVKEYGDLGDNELKDRAGTIPQALLRMNGKLSREMCEPNIANAAGRINALASGTDSCLEMCYLVCLSRRPTPAEVAVLLPMFEDSKNARREAVVEDIYWSLFNAPEFSWNH